MSCLSRRLSWGNRWYRSPWKRLSHTSTERLPGTRSAIVALESTVITHGMPYPSNLKTAKSLESIIREHGAIPATIAIINGKPTLGLSAAQLEGLARDNHEKKAHKVSRRDLPFVISQKLNGGTTVSATMLLAQKAGITIFSTGGIGGVHRNGESTMDISADLTELGRTPVAVVCAGVKSILDIQRTLEYLETQGVCVATIGETNDFPSFFSRESSFRSPWHVRNEVEAAELLAAHQELGLRSGVLFAVPIPEKHALPLEDVENWLSIALEECVEKEVGGNDVTPFLLRKLNELSKGATLTANIALLENNAMVAAKIAVNLERIGCGPKVKFGRRDGVNAVSVNTGSSSSSFRNPVIIGGTVLDILTKSSVEFQINGSTHHGEITTFCGGVGRNIADCMTRLGIEPTLLSAIGNDYNGDFIKTSCAHMNMTKVLQSDDTATSSYVGLLDPTGQLLAGIMNMDAHSLITPEYVEQNKKIIADSGIMILDGNVSVECLDYALQLAGEYDLPVFYEPTDPKKAHRPFRTGHWKNITFLSPNLKEFHSITKHLGLAVSPEFLDTTPDGSEQMELLENVFGLLPRLELLMIKLGKKGSLVTSRTELHLPYRKQNSKSGKSLYARLYLAPEVKTEDILSVSGSGDCMVAGFITGILQGWTVNRSIDFGTAAASWSLRSKSNVPAEVSRISGA